MLADLARSEFSDFEILNTWPIPQSLNAKANGERVRRPVPSERQKVFDAWRARHEALPDEQIEALLEKARAAEALRTDEREAIKRALNEAAEHNRTAIEWKLWSSLPTVKIWEAAALYAGLNPEAWSFESISAAGPLGRTGGFARAFSRLMRASGPHGPVKLVGEAHPGSLISTRQAAAFMVETCDGQPPAEFAELATPTPTQTVQLLESGNTAATKDDFKNQPCDGIDVVVRHSTRGRREDILAPVLKRAKELAGTGATTANVWAQLERLARSEDAPPPLIDVVPGGVLYEEGVEQKTLTRKQFGDRMGRALRRDSSL